MTPAALAELVRRAAVDMLDARGLDNTVLPRTVPVTRPRRGGHGDYATTLALSLAKRVGVTPRELAGWLADSVAARGAGVEAEVAGPGFLNLRLDAAARGALLRDVLDRKAEYGRGERLAGAVVTLRVPAEGRLGDLPLAAARAAVAGAAVRRLLVAQSARVVTEPHQDERAGRPRIRAGSATTFGDLVAAVGIDAATYVLVGSGEAAALDIDLDAWRRRTDDNPLFLVQHAYARMASTLRHAADLDIPVPDSVDHRVEAEALTHERERELINTIADFGRVVETAAARREPRVLARYLAELAEACHAFGDHCPVLPRGDDPADARTTARLTLCRAARQVLANGLAVLGVSAPERI